MLGAVGPAGRAVSPYPSPRPEAPYDYTALHIENGSCAGALGPDGKPAGSDLPANFHCVESHKLTSRAAQPGEPDYSPLVTGNAQELFGVKGSSTNNAWEITTGRPDVVIAVMDSGIRWDEPRTNLVNKFELNRGELPVPGGDAKGQPLTSYDLNRDGQLDVRDYASDGRVTDRNSNGIIDPQDLIRIFSDGVDDDGNHYVDDVSGWDFYENDNDANDDVDYGHGTGEAEDSAGETGVDLLPQCPNCRLMMMRVGDSFVADVNHFAEAVLYATDNGASVVQSALGTLNNTGFAQAALDYAYERGVLAVTSAADESAGHHNMPSALNHTMTVNSVAPPVVDGAQQPPTYLSFNGCTNFGGYIWVTVPSTSCSSDAVAQAAGMTGLVYSAAANAVDLGVIAPSSTGKPISAEEAKQVFRACAEDVDFSTPKPPLGPPNNFVTSLPASARFVTTAGWDQVAGFGRTNADCMVRLVAKGAIPPEADITSPRWWEPFGNKGKVDVIGRVDAPRSHRFSYRVEVAPGVQPPRWPAQDQWTKVGGENGRTSAKDGVLATFGLSQVRQLINAAVPAYTPLDDPTSRDLPERDAFRVRVVVTDGSGRQAIEQRPAFALPEQGVLPGFPRYLGADGAGSVAFADLDGDGRNELVFADGNGTVHAMRADGSEAPGWPRRTPPYHGRPDVAAAVLGGSPTIADLDGDGGLEVAVADIEGNLSVWHHDGTVVAGFPVRPLAQFSAEPNDDAAPPKVRDRLNPVDHAFTFQASAGDLAPSIPGLELVVGSNDGHVYAFGADGSLVPGWPVLLRDPTKVAAVDPVTHRVDYLDGSGAKFGRKVLATPSIGDVDGDGDLEVAVNVNEEYEEPVNASVLRDPVAPVIAQVQAPGNTRVYLLHHDGTAHPSTAVSRESVHPDDQAYVNGWPVPIAMLTLELLPYVGEGSNGAPVLADVDGDGKLEIATASIAGPPYLLKADGTSAFGNGLDGAMLTMASMPTEFKNPTTTDGPSYASLGGGVWGRLDPTGPPSFAIGATGVRRLLDVVLPEQQLLAEDHISAWDPRTGSYLPGFPAQMNDLMFFNTPAIADVDGDGLNEVLQGSATYDLRAYSIGGVAPSGWPKQVAGWVVATPAVGDLDGDGLVEVAITTREGWLFVFKGGGSVCQPQEWPKFQGNLRNTGVYGDNDPLPARCR